MLRYFIIAFLIPFAAPWGFSSWVDDVGDSVKSVAENGVAAVSDTANDVAGFAIDSANDAANFAQSASNTNEDHANSVIGETAYIIGQTAGNQYLI